MSTTHELATAMLAPYVDGALPLGEAAAVRAHLAECGPCSTEVSGLEQLNRALAFPPAPPYAFHAFWAGIEKRLPRRRPGPVRVVRRSLGLAFALAALLVLATAASAFAADRILPDSPLYSLKLWGETVRVDLAPSRHDRVQLELQLAAERLDEAAAMAKQRKGHLAAGSLRDFQSLLADARPALEHPAASDREQARQAIGGLTVGLDQVNRAVAEAPDESDAEAQAIIQDSQASLVQVEQESESQPAETAQPETSAAPNETPEASAAPRESPEQSNAPAGGDD